MIDPALYWLMIGVMLLFLGLAVPGGILFFFGLGALVAALVAWLFQVNILCQLTLFMLTSLVPLFCLRKKFHNKLPALTSEGEEEKEEVMLAVFGEKGVVSSTITPPAEGKIKYSGALWRATADEIIEEGEIVSVISEKNLIIHVEKV